MGNVVKTVAVLGCLDTKATEIMYAKDIIERSGGKAYIIDMSVRDDIDMPKDVSPQRLLGYNGIKWDDVMKMGKSDRISTMADVLKVAIKAIYEEGEFDGIFAMGGAQNSLMASGAMIKLPYGVPKLLLSTLASGKRIYAPYVDTKDMVVMHSVADISGMNSITKTVIGNAVAAVLGMVNFGVNAIGTSEKTIVGTTMLGITGKGVERIKEMVEADGYETITFHANGVGGKAMEELIYSGMIDVSMDLTIHEMANELIGGYCTGANNRLVAAGEMGIPQLIAPGAIDMIDYATDETGNSYPDDWEKRQKIFHNKSIIHMKVQKDEIVKLAGTVAERLNAAKGKVTVLLPRKGFVEAGAVGGKFYNEEIDSAFIETLKGQLSDRIKVVEFDGCINDEAFAVTAYEAFKQLVGK